MTETRHLAGNELRQPAEFFYSRLNYGEREKVKMVVGGLREYLAAVVEDDFLVAGVGGILRYEHPGLAQDIDLAAVGLKYTNTPASARNHGFDNVIRFTETVNEYFERFSRKMVIENGFVENQEFGFGRGSSPFSGLNKKFIVGPREKPLLELRSDLESFGWYNSKGLSISFPAIRPIDVQFVFNETTEEWEDCQRGLAERPGAEGRDTSNLFPYAIL